MKKNKQTIYEKLGIPQQINIQNEIYTFKVELINSYVSYRSIHRACNASAKITIENAKKLFGKEDEKTSIEFIYVGEHKNHPKKIITDEQIDNVKTEKKN